MLSTYILAAVCWALCCTQRWGRGNSASGLPFHCRKAQETHVSFITCHNTWIITLPPHRWAQRQRSALKVKEVENCFVVCVSLWQEKKLWYIYCFHPIREIASLKKKSKLIHNSHHDTTTMFSYFIASKVCTVSFQKYCMLWWVK